MDKKNMVIGVLMVAVLLMTSFYAYEKSTEKKDAKRVAELEAEYQKGVLVGADQAIRWVFQKAGECQQVPLTIDEQRLTLIAVECLNP